MRKFFTTPKLLLSLSFLLLIIASCKKEKTTPKPVDATPIKIGLYEEIDSIIYKIPYIPVTKLGTQTLSTQFNAQVFDTGSGGMVIDAEGILPASMISTSNGFSFAGADSIVYAGITITNQKNTISYGDDADISTVYGNLAYADVTVGDETGNVVIKHVPFLLYYKATDKNGKLYDPHEFDVFGANPQFDISIGRNSSVAIQSPFNYYTPGTGLTKGFKIAALGTGNFSSASEIPITPGVITLGLTVADLASSSGFTTSTLQNNANDGADPYLPATITYNNKSITGSVLFDTGTAGYNYIEDPTADKTTTILPTSTPVKVLLSTGFDYSFTTMPTDYLTQVENPSTSTNPVSILSIEFFLTNEYMLDYTHNTIGLKNN